MWFHRLWTHWHPGKSLRFVHTVPQSSWKSGDAAGSSSQWLLLCNPEWKGSACKCNRYCLKWHTFGKTKMFLYHKPDKLSGRNKSGRSSRGEKKHSGIHLYNWITLLQQHMCIHISSVAKFRHCSEWRESRRPRDPTSCWKAAGRFSLHFRQQPHSSADSTMTSFHPTNSIPNWSETWTSGAFDGQIRDDQGTVSQRPWVYVLERYVQG